MVKGILEELESIIYAPIQPNKIKKREEKQDKNKLYQEHYNMTNHLSSWDKPIGRKNENFKKTKQQSKKKEEVTLHTIRR